MKNNVDGLIAAAKNKREEVIKRANEAINAMIDSNDIITFASVARKAKITKAWLYRESSVREKINNCRAFPMKNALFTEQTTTKSDQTYILSLENKIIQLEKVNAELKKQIEIMYGKFFLQSG